MIAYLILLVKSARASIAINKGEWAKASRILGYEIGPSILPTGQE